MSSIAVITHCMTLPNFFTNIPETATELVGTITQRPGETIAEFTQRCDAEIIRLGQLTIGDVMGTQLFGAQATSRFYDGVLSYETTSEVSESF